MCTCWDPPSEQSYMLAYADAALLIGKSGIKTKHLFSKLSAEESRIVLKANNQKTKYIIVQRCKMNRTRSHI